MCIIMTQGKIFVYYKVTSLSGIKQKHIYICNSQENSYGSHRDPYLNDPVSYWYTNRKTPWRVSEGKNITENSPIFVKEDN